MGLTITSGRVSWASRGGTPPFQPGSNLADCEFELNLNLLYSWSRGGNVLTKLIKVFGKP